MQPGTRLGHYEILAPLGAGGMGQVYRARDTTLDRDVAIKVLPEDLSSDPDRLSRFEREAKLLAALNHPNIATIHGFDESDGVRFIAMELVEGQSLDARIAASGRIEIDEALEIARRIALALEAAHQAGIIHRDLKPANVQVTRDGDVKVLDFGLAKAYEADGTEPSADLSQSPTMIATTGTGVIMGTAPYMSPEQARGKPVDKRTDIWALGCLLYEMLTGSMAFGGGTVSDVLVAVLDREPDWTALPPVTSPIIRLLLRQCLRKDPSQRLHDVADVRVGIVDAIQDPNGGIAPSGDSGAVMRSSWWHAMPTPVALGIAALAAMVVWGLSGSETPPPEPSVTARSNIVLPTDVQTPTTLGPAPLAISRDGTKLVYAGVEGGIPRLYLRSIDALSASRLTGSEGGYGPFFSPDGQWVGFAAEGKLLKVSVAGGPPLPIGDVEFLRGASWAEDDTIILAPGFSSALTRVPAGGGGARTHHHAGIRLRLSSLAAIAAGR